MQVYRCRFCDQGHNPALVCAAIRFILAAYEDDSAPGEDVIERMHPVAAHLPATVGGRDMRGFAGLLEGRTVRDLRAVILILAEAADPARLEAVTGLRVPLAPQQAHEMFVRLSRNGAPVPAAVTEGEHVWRLAHRKAAARRGAA